MKPRLNSHGAGQSSAGWAPICADAATSLLIVSLSGVLLIQSPAVAAQLDWNRAEQNRQQVQGSQRSSAQLPPAELEELRQYLALLARRPRPKPETRQDCIERNATSDTPSELELAALRLKCSGRPERQESGHDQ